MKMIRVSGESRRRQACTSKPFMSGIHTSRIATRHGACSSLARKAAGWLNFSTIKPAEFINRPSALSMETSSSRSQIPSQAEALTGEPLVSKFALGMPNPVLFIHNYYGTRIDAELVDANVIAEA